MAVAKKKLTFEDRMTALEALADRMDAGNMTLEESLKQYEAALQEIVALEGELAGVMQRCTVLRQQAEGVQEEIPLEDAEETA